MSLDDAPQDLEAQRLRELFQAAPGLIAVVRGPDHVFEFVNDAYRRFAGEREFIGRPAREVMPELEEQGLLALLDDVYRSGERVTGTNRVVAVAREAGGPLAQHHINFVYEPIRDAAGRVTGIFAEGVDVTDEDAVPFIIYEPLDFTVTGAPKAPVADPVTGDPTFTG